MNMACEVCGEELVARDGPGRPARFCSARCRQRGYVGRQREVARASRVERLERLEREVKAQKPKGREERLFREEMLRRIGEELAHANRVEARWEAYEHPAVRKVLDDRTAHALAETEVRKQLRREVLEPEPERVSPAVRVLSRSEDDKRREQLLAEYPNLEGWSE